MKTIFYKIPERLLQIIATGMLFAFVAKYFGLVDLDSIDNDTIMIWVLINFLFNSFGFNDQT